MNILEWLTGRLSSRGKALSLYRRGMKRAKRQDHAGAFDDYTATVGMTGVPPDVKAMALFNRALVLAADGDNLLAIDDLNVVLALAERGTKKTCQDAARVRQDRWRSAPNHLPSPWTE